MRIVLTAESWPTDSTDTIPAVDVAVLAAYAWRAAAPLADVVGLPLGDGGPRTMAALPGSRIRWGPVDAVETTSGMVLAPRDGGHAWVPGELAAALAELSTSPEKRAVIVPVGDATPSGDPLDVWGGDLPARRVALASLNVIVLVGTSRPLLGFNGMAADIMVGREGDLVSATASHEVERRWTDIARVADPLVSTSNLFGAARLSDTPGSGAGGGLSYVLAAVGARILPGAAFAAGLAGFPEVGEGADLLVAICGDVTPRSLDNGTSAPVGAEAARRGVPCVVIAPRVMVGKRDLMAAGIAGAYEAASGADALAARLARVARTWTHVER